MKDAGLGLGESWVLGLDSEGFGFKLGFLEICMVC